MPSATLDFSQPPLSLLSPAQRAAFDRACDVVLFARGRTALREGESSAAVYFVINGHLQASRARADGGEDTLADYAAGDVLGAFAVLTGQARFSYRALEDALCFAVDAAVFRAAVAENLAFAAWFQEGLAAKRQLLGTQLGQSDLAETMLARVSDARLAPALRLPADTSLAAARLRMKRAGVTCVLVDDGAAQPGIVTRTDMLDALTLEGAGADAPIGRWLRRPLRTVQAGDVLFQALVSMTEHHVERVVVMEEGVIRGTLGLSEVLSHFSSHSHLVSIELARADSVEEVVAAARRLPALIRQLHAHGARMSYLMELVSALNSRLFQTLFRLLVPAEWQPRLCLLVLGSEGRREQIMRTDQDNALIHDGSLDDAEMAPLMETFSRALQDCGFPPCAGGVMVNNPHWRGDSDTWIRRVGEIRRLIDPVRLLELAILVDARVVAGEPALFEPLRPVLFERAGAQVVLQQFAAAALEFPTPLGLFGRLRAGEDGLDIKKGGLFPLVQGLRALALQHGIDAGNSFRRAAVLGERGGLPAALAADVQQAMAVFHRQRLAAQLDAEKRGELPNNRLPVATLSRLDRELLRDALGVVDAFKRWLRQAFYL